jgi:hypothetical protein
MLTAKRLLLSLGAAPLLAVATATPAAASNASCGGTAPRTTTCTASGTIAGPTSAFVQADLAYTGQVTITVTTVTLTYTRTCTFAAVGTCNAPTVTGAAQVGQHYTVTGNATGVGSWSVGVVS